MPGPAASGPSVDSLTRDEVMRAGSVRARRNARVGVSADGSMWPAIEEIAEQIYDSQSLDDIALPEDTPYTSQIILDAVRDAVEKAAVH